MEQIGKLIADIFRVFTDFIPRTCVIESTRGGVAHRGSILDGLSRIFLKGKDKKKATLDVIRLDPGFHIYWPIRTNVEFFPTARQTTNLPTQCLTTKDKETIVVGGIVVFKVEDVVKVLKFNYDMDDTIKDISLAVIKSVIVERNLGDIIKNQGEIDKLLTEKLKEDLKEYGISVIHVYISDFAKCMVIKNLGEKTTYLPSKTEIPTN